MSYTRRAESFVARPNSSFRYGFTAFILSCISSLVIVVATSVPGIPPAFFRRGDWLPYIPFMLIAGVGSAFIFRKWIRAANGYTFAPLSVLVGVVISALAALIPGFVYYAWFGPLIYFQIWPITVPVSLLFTWVLRIVDRKLEVSAA